MKKYTMQLSKLSIIICVMMAFTSIVLTILIFIDSYAHMPHKIGKDTCYFWDDGDWQLIGRVGKEPVSLVGYDAGLDVDGIDCFAELTDGQLVFLTSAEYTATIKSETGSIDIKNGDRYIYVDMASDNFEFLSSLKHDDQGKDIIWVCLE